MIINITHLLEKEFAGEFEERPRRFPALVHLTGQGEFRFHTTLKANLRAQRNRNIIEVTGGISTMIGLSCSRCLKPFDAPFSRRVVITYTTGKSNAQEGGHRLSKTPTEEENAMMGVLSFAGDKLNLREGIQEQILLNLPRHPLCAKSCRGLCPSCGADLNTEKCGCGKKPEEDSPFSGLKDLVSS